MDPIDKLAEALEHVHNVDVNDAHAGGTLIAGYEAIRTYSLAAIAHELHHLRHEQPERVRRAAEAQEVRRGWIAMPGGDREGLWDSGAPFYVFSRREAAEAAAEELKGGVVTAPGVVEVELTIE